jgi:hypothetical protein
MKLSLLHATRDNPANAMTTAAVWLSRASNPEDIEHIFAIQEDDRLSTEVFKTCNQSYVTTPPPPEWASSSVANWNAAARQATGDWLLVIADDLLPPPGWDQDFELLGIRQEPCAVYAPDQMSDDGLLRHPIVNRAFMAKRGHLFDPDFYGVYCDNDLNLWCQDNDVPVIKWPGLAFYHDHPIANPETEWSDVTRKQNSDRAYAYGQQMLAKKWPAIVPRPIERTHSVWIGSELSIMEQLTLRLILRHGHKATIWVQEDVAGVPAGVDVRRIPEGLLPPIRFAGKPHPSIPKGGHGSFAQWSDYFAFHTLATHPGDMWIQLDVAATAPLHAATNTFTLYVGGLQTCCFTMQPDLAAKCRDKTGEMIQNDMATLEWHDTMTEAQRIMRNSGVAVTTQSNFFDCGCLPTSPYNAPCPRDKYRLIHWSNATHHQSKRDPVVGSLYWQLLRETGLI